MSAAEFDFGYLQFKLGKPGQTALDRMLALDHPEKIQIRLGVERARAADSYWQYKSPSDETDIPTESDGTTSDGPMSLELNPAEEPVQEVTQSDAENELAPDNN